MALDLKKLLWSWLFLPLTALDWWAAWSRLPEHVPMKYGPDGQPMSWATRDQALTFELVFLTVFLGVTSIVLFVVASKRPERLRPAFAISTAANALVFLILNVVLWRYQVP